MKRFTLTAACLIAAATPAYAANWTVLHAGRAACITGAEAGRLFGTPSPLSPFLLERLERSDDNFATTDVHRGPANEIEWGEVTSLKHITIPRAHCIEANKDSLGAMVNGWVVTKGLGVYGTDYMKRAVVAAFGWPANLPQDAVYPYTEVDGGDGSSREQTGTR